MMKYIVLFFALTFALNSNAQTFGAELVGGLTVSQIDGDASAGYNKIGFVAGANALINLKEKQYTSIGILFSQRGAQDELSNMSNTASFSLRLDYIEVPVLFHYRDWLVDEDEGLYRMDFHGGLSYARLMKAKLRDTGIGGIGSSDVLNRLVENDFAVVLGAGYHFSKEFSLVFQWKRSLIPMYKPGGNTAASPKGLNWISHQLTGQAVYTF